LRVPVGFLRRSGDSPVWACASTESPSRESSFYGGSPSRGKSLPEIGSSRNCFQSDHENRSGHPRKEGFLSWKLPLGDLTVQELLPFRQDNPGQLPSGQEHPGIFPEVDPVDEEELLPIRRSDRAPETSLSGGFHDRNQFRRSFRAFRELLPIEPEVPVEGQPFTELRWGVSGPSSPGNSIGIASS
jgi:hypothetical protein